MRGNFIQHFFTTKTVSNFRGKIGLKFGARISSAILKVALFFFGILFLQHSVFSQNAQDVSQTLVPIEVYVGDMAEIRYSFKLDSGIPFEENFETEISAEKIPFEEISDSVTVNSARFFRHGDDFAFTLRFVPWRAGKIEFPPFDLHSVLGVDAAATEENYSFEISLLPIEIKSIVEKTGRAEMQGPLPPLLMPGTSYVVFVLVVVAVIFLAAVFRALVKFHDLKRWFLQMKIRRTRRRNSIITLRKLKKNLRNEDLSDIEFCAGLQNIARAYLSFRFDFPFESESAMGIQSAFQKIFLGEIPDAVFPVLEDLVSMFIRTDYIRYAHGSLDEAREPKSEHEAHLASGERKLLTSALVKAVKVFEGDMPDQK